MNGQDNTRSQRSRPLVAPRDRVPRDRVPAETLDRFHLRHRHLVLHGVDAGERGRTLLAALASQPEVHLLHRTPQGLVEITREGPTGIVTTDKAFGDHLLDRGLAWPLDLSGAPTRALESRLPSRGELVDARVWQCAQAMLEVLEVVVPFEEALTETIGFDAIPKDENDRTDDQARLLALVRASALLHQRQREQDDGKLVATLDDYQLVYALADELFTLEAQDLAPQVIAVGEAVGDLLKEQQHKTNAKDEDTAEACVMRVALERRLEWSTRVVNKWVARAEEAGVVEVEHARGRRPARLRRGSHPLVTSLLPEPASLAESQEKETGEVQH